MQRKQNVDNKHFSNCIIDALKFWKDRCNFVFISVTCGMVYHLNQCVRFVAFFIIKRYVFSRLFRYVRNDDKYQESIQPSTTPDPGYHILSASVMPLGDGRTYSYTSIYFYILSYVGPLRILASGRNLILLTHLLGGARYIALFLPIIINRLNKTSYFFPFHL